MSHKNITCCYGETARYWTLLKDSFRKLVNSTKIGTKRAYENGNEIRDAVHTGSLRALVDKFRFDKRFYSHSEYNSGTLIDVFDCYGLKFNRTMLKPAPEFKKPKKVNGLDKVTQGILKGDSLRAPVDDFRFDERFYTHSEFDNNSGQMIDYFDCHGIKYKRFTNKPKKIGPIHKKTKVDEILGIAKGDPLKKTVKDLISYFYGEYLEPVSEDLKELSREVSDFLKSSPLKRLAEHYRNEFPRRKEKYDCMTARKLDSLADKLLDISRGETIKDLTREGIDYLRNLTDKILGNYTENPKVAGKKIRFENFAEFKEEFLRLRGKSKGWRKASLLLARKNRSLRKIINDITDFSNDRCSWLRDENTYLRSEYSRLKQLVGRITSYGEYFRLRNENKDLRAKLEEAGKKVEFFKETVPYEYRLDVLNQKMGAHYLFRKYDCLYLQLSLDNRSIVLKLEKVGKNGSHSVTGVAFNRVVDPEEQLDTTKTYKKLAAFLELSPEVPLTITMANAYDWKKSRSRLDLYIPIMQFMLNTGLYHDIRKEENSQ